MHARRTDRTLRLVLVACLAGHCDVIRRFSSGASLMVGGGVPRLVVSKILNHVETGVTAVYDRHSYDPEKRRALDYWGNRLEQIVSAERGANVLAFAG